MLNKIILQARLCKDVELRRLPSGKAVASVSVACDRDFTNKESGERETDFIDIVAFGGTGEFMAKHFSKGSMAIVSGRLQIRPWTDKEGNKRRSAEVVADSVYFGDSKKDSGSTNHPQNTNQGSYGDAAMNNYKQDFQQIDIPDEHLPF